ncbi:tRNA dimethylallyltransferase [Enterococcus sp. 8G7_MSG3316]|uniref:tRNA dimethylallyltransferase n=1 Tax=Candidatus Enterococcus testudinis TaxID=1834191 RepID=A0A242A3T9_9ENTE|nr:tRNA (adenosine(37)-N6)-dimethylallyltransferase MiaA [Enterococcus sp. 8G7_MSG3316]OTN75560.1 tRNA dimethylallyltransferase [Enterococcus sp. 8G7_MSG3316]
MKKVLVIVGPTAVGKTALSLELAKHYHGEIISGDSMQIYRQLDIGTAKATKEELAAAPHHLIDIREMTEQYSVAMFQEMAREKIAEITGRGHLPIIVGGTGLYIQALLYDYRLGAAEEVDDTLRNDYQAQAEELGKEALWQKLQQIDPAAAAKIHYNNVRKVIRALEVFETTGQSIITPKEVPAALYDYFMIGLTTDRGLLYQRINQRVDQMMDMGLLEEAKNVLRDPDTQAAKGIGYKEFLPYIEGRQSLEETIEQIKQNSRRYAKRQLTWFSNRLTPRWVDLVQEPNPQKQIMVEIDQWLEEKQ